MTVEPTTTIDTGHAANVLAQMLHIAGGGTIGANATPDGQAMLDQMSAQSNPPASTSDTTNDTTATPGADAVGLVNPTVSQGYGAGNDHDHGGHPGIDLAVPVGTPLVAAENGVVTVASNADPGGYGNEVEITAPDGTVMRYGHLSAINVQVGQQIKAGAPIGKSGGEAGAAGSGNSTGAHLHFEVRKNGTTVDPTPYLAGGAGVVSGSATDNPAVQAAPDAATQATNILDLAQGKTPPPDQTHQNTTTSSTGSTADDDPNAVDAFLGAIRQHESGGDYHIYNQSGLSNASGAYQFLGSTWKGLGGSTANAAEASPAEQDAIARRYALQLFNQFHSWKLAAIAWYGGPGVAEQVARGQDPGSPEGQGPYLAYGNTIASMMNGAKHG